MACLTCEDAEKVHAKRLEKIKKAEQYAREYAIRNNIKTMEIVRVVNGSYSFKPFGEEHNFEIVHYLYVNQDTSVQQLQSPDS